MTESYLFYVSFLLAGVLGYLAGRLDFVAARLARVPGPAPGTLGHLLSKSSAAPPRTAGETISIDGSTVVTKIDTSGMTRADTHSLGTATTAADDINAAASRLAQLKGK
jgi:hypothetical protein